MGVVDGGGGGVAAPCQSPRGSKMGGKMNILNYKNYFLYLINFNLSDKIKGKSNK
jgi:hypothetical protein